jgi:hypothetical protein
LGRKKERILEPKALPAKNQTLRVNRTNASLL